ncbi:MAG: thioredoxin domain-containing protein [Patescibacteria group bacterium]
MEGSPKNQQFLVGLLGGIAVMAVIGLIIMAVVMFANNGTVKGDTANTNQPVVQGNNQAPAPETSGPDTESVTAGGITTFFQKKGAKICTEDGKPVVYLFSTTWCPHCTWVKSTFDETMKEYVDAGKIKAYHFEVDTGDDTLTPETETAVPESALAVYNEFNPGGSIPTFVMGCKYFRVGNGYEQQDDLEAEKAEFQAAIKDLVK